MAAPLPPQLQRSLAGRAAAVLLGTLAVVWASPVAAQVVGGACASPSATMAANVLPFETATPSATAICSGGTWKLLPQLVSNTTLNCESATTGLLRYSGGLQVCSGSAWTTLGATTNLSETLSLNDLSDAATNNTLYSMFLGHQSGGTSGYPTTASNSTALGYRTLYSLTSGYNNTAIGALALTNNTSAYANTAVGIQALYSLTTGVQNTAIGGASLFSLTEGNNNTALGYSVLNMMTGASNLAAGTGAMRNPSGGSSNVALGVNAARGITDTVITGTVALGYQAGFALTSSTGNTLLGYQAGSALTSGNYNILIGYNVNPYDNTGSNQLNIGNTIYGDLGTKKIGIGVTSPSDTLDVSGSLTVRQYIRGRSPSGYLGIYENTGPSDGPGIQLIGNSYTSNQGELQLIAGQPGNIGFSRYNGSTYDRLMTIVSTGLVGIGVTSPTANLDVSGTGLFGGYVGIGETNIYGNIRLVVKSIGTGTTTFGLAVRDSAGANNFYIRDDGAGWLKGALAQNSDATLKRDVVPVENALDRLTQLRGVTYRWKADGPEGKQHYGVIAQEVEKTFPEMVDHNSEGTKTVAYGELTAPLIEAVKELKRQLADLKARNAALDVYGTVSATVVAADTISASGIVRLKRHSGEPASCDATQNGSLALTSAPRMCICDGTSWKDVGSNYGACTW